MVVYQKWQLSGMIACFGVEIRLQIKKFRSEEISPQDTSVTDLNKMKGSKPRWGVDNVTASSHLATDQNDDWKNCDNNVNDDQK